MISILIATRNRAHLLADTLEALRSLQDPGTPYEIVVIDNGSTDATRDIVAAAAIGRSVPVVYEAEPRPGKSHALNAGIDRARGDLLVLADDDELPCPEWLVALDRAVRETGADFVVGRIVPLWESPPPRWWSPDLSAVLGVPDVGGARLPIASGVNDHIMPLAGNMALRRHVLDALGGWNADLGKLEGTLRTGEDHEFALRLLAAGYRGVYEPAAWLRHRIPADRLRLTYFARWYYANGGVEALLEHEYPSTAHYLFGVPRYLWREAGLGACSTVAAAMRGKGRRAVAGGMRLVWFAGYLRERWFRRSAARARVHAASLSPRQPECEP